ncbi:MAG: cytochrome ubiquinol oxidase subunit I [Actinomycetota bacterium]|nr:cytochrome ubiquinol oxidase subunit I [Actinomycetota bacterium]
MPIGDIEIPGIGKEVVMATIWQSHILWAAFIVGILLIASVSEYMAVLTKQPKYDRFAKGAAIATILLFATGSFTPILGLLMLVTLYPVFWSYAQNILFWPLFAEAFMFVGEIILIYAWYASWDKLAYRKKLHVVLGFTAAMLLIAQQTFINVVGSYLLTPALAEATNVAATYLNPTFVPLNMHRFVGNISYAGFLVAGFAAWRYLRSTGEGDREYYDWMGHWGLIWGFGFVLLQPILGFGYLKSIREHNSAAFDYIMLGDKAWLFNLLVIWLGIMSVTSVAYCLHKLRFAVKPMPTLRNITLGALGFMAVFSLLNVIPSDLYLVPQIGLVFGEKLDPNIALTDPTPVPLGEMYPWKFIGLIGIVLVGVSVLGLYLKAAVGGFRWGNASRWSQYALIVTAVSVVLTMMTMGYTRETARRGSDPGYLINSCITLQQEVVAEGCTIAPETPEGGTP